MTNIYVIIFNYQESHLLSVECVRQNFMFSKFCRFARNPTQKPNTLILTNQSLWKRQLSATTYIAFNHYHKSRFRNAPHESESKQNARDDHLIPFMCNWIVSINCDHANKNRWPHLPSIIACDAIVPEGSVKMWAGCPTEDRPPPAMDRCVSVWHADHMIWTMSVVSTNQLRDNDPPF